MFNILNRKKEVKVFCTECKIKIPKRGLLSKGGYEYEDGFLCKDCHFERLRVRRVRKNE